jgi:glycosyltransferase involved in cell wall biosynthesis
MDDRMTEKSVTDVSVVIPAYNVAGFIELCLASVQAQSMEAWECIVVDDGSQDGTPERIQAVSDQRIRLIRQSNQGVSAARNAGLAAAQGRYVMFLDGDDLLHPTALERLLGALEGHRGAVAAFGTFIKLLANGAPYPQQKPLSQHRYPSGDVLSRMLEENFLANGGHVLVRTAVAQQVGGFDVRLRLSEDWEFWCRLAAAGEFLFIGTMPEVFYLRVHGGSSSGLLACDWENHRRSVDTVLNNPELQKRFEADAWAGLRRRVTASHLWEAGRVNFSNRRFAAARRLMFQSLRMHPRRKRLALFAIAQLSQAANRSLVSRLRFRDDDERAR